MGGVGKSSGNTSGSQGYSDAYITSKITVKNDRVTGTHINETVRRVQEGLQLISQADPILSRALSEIMSRMSFDLTYDTGRDMAYAAGLGKISFNTATYGTKGDPIQLTRFTEGGRFHPAEGGSFTFIHEMGHILSNKYTLPPNVRGGFGDFDDAEKAIVNRAFKAHKREFPDWKKSDFTGTISRYASTNKSETIAEAFADVVINGSNAKRASRRVYDELVTAISAHF